METYKYVWCISSPYMYWTFQHCRLLSFLGHHETRSISLTRIYSGYWFYVHPFEIGANNEYEHPGHECVALNKGVTANIFRFGLPCTASLSFIKKGKEWVLRNFGSLVLGYSNSYGVTYRICCREPPDSFYYLYHMVQIYFQTIELISVWQVRSIALDNGQG